MGMRLGPINYIYADAAEMYLKKRREGVSCELYVKFESGKFVLDFDRDMQNKTMPLPLVRRIWDELRGDLMWLASRYRAMGFEVNGSVSEKPEWVELVIRVYGGKER